MNRLDADIKHILLLIQDKEDKQKRMQDDIDAWKHRLAAKKALKEKSEVKHGLN